MMNQVDGMTKLKLHIRSVALLLALSLSNVILAAEISNENKHNGSGNTVSNADHAGHVNGNISFTVNAKTNSSNKQQPYLNDAQNFQRMEALRRQLQADQLEAYKRYMKNRKQPSSVNNLPPDVQARREEYIKHMNERRELINKMRDERRKVAEKRRQSMLQKIQQTSTTPVTTGKT